MPLSVNGVVCTLVLLVLWRTDELAEACSCAPVHPQQAFCNADVGESSAGVVDLLQLHICPESAAFHRLLCSLDRRFLKAVADAHLYIYHYACNNALHMSHSGAQGCIKNE